MHPIQNIDELRVFVQVADAGSIVEAARVLEMAPLTAGRRLAALETRLGTPLLHRSTRSQSLSEAGRLLLPQARAVLRTVDEAEALLHQSQDAMSGTVRIRVLTVLADDVLRAAHGLLQRHPELRIDVQVGDRPGNPIQEGLDVTIVGGALHDSALVARKLMEIELTLAAHRDYLAEHGTPTTPEQLSSHWPIGWAGPTEETTWRLRSHAEPALERVVRVRPRVRIHSARTMADALCQRLGIGVTSVRLVERTEGLVPVLPGWSAGRAPLYALYPSAGRRTVRLQRIVNALAEVLQRQSGVAAGGSSRTRA